MTKQLKRKNYLNQILQHNQYDNQLESRKPPRVFFNFSVIEKTTDLEKSKSPAVPKSPPVLKPDTKYIVLVWTDDQTGKMGHSSPHSANSPISMNKDTNLSLKISTKPELFPYLSILAKDTIKITRKQIYNEFQHTFILETSPELPSGKFTLKLEFQKTIKRFINPLPVAELMLESTGNYTLPNKEFLEEKCCVEIDQKRPENTAVIHVGFSNKEVYLIGWAYNTNRIFSTSTFPAPDFKLSELKYIGEIYRLKAKKYSKECLDFEFKKWLQGLANTVDENFHLIIFDDTDYEIPWEMLEIDESVYIGTIFPIVRWTRVPCWENKWKRLKIQEIKSIGRIISYIDENAITHTEIEKKIFDVYQNTPCSDFEHLKERLKEPLNGVSMIYLGCHGIFSYDEMEIALGSLKNPSNRLVALEVEDLPYHEIDFGRPVVFVNACHSARLHKSGDRFVGLPKVFLDRIACGYIGTIGSVESEFAVRIAEFILQDFQEEEIGISPAKALQKLRANALNNLKNNKHQKCCEDMFLFSFMYIYYGNPLTKIYLAPLKGLKKQDGTCGKAHND